MQAIRRHAQEAYGEECCGVLFGRREGPRAEVEAVSPLPNSRDGERHRRFFITAADYRRAEAEAEGRRLELLGFYHSHPDHPSRPSAFDLEHAWPWFSYVIVSVGKDGAREARSFVMKADRSAFVEEQLETSDPLALEKKSIRG